MDELVLFQQEVPRRLSKVNTSLHTVFLSSVLWLMATISITGLAACLNSVPKPVLLSAPP